ncbi:ABC transporter substrate-binding protein [Luteolibacter sp. Populi]|uniref:ABC transporter substrate-binding protein n=1 Tax=Luteolibacter sp. Populi TaxID=3230487 RepID=UPI003464EAAB
MMRRFLPILLLLIAVIAAPIIMRRSSELAAASQAQDRLVIITPHNETIRSEFGEAFAAYWKNKTGRTLYIDWRIPGGTSDITRVINSSFEAAEEIKSSGIGTDIFFGGGEPDFATHAKKGRFVPLEVFTTHPQWFKEDIIPAKFTGENYYDVKHLWVGTCLSQMGICYNSDSITRLKIVPPYRWEDLADPAYFGYIALADPTKSGSVTRMYEMMIQEQMKKVIKEKGDSDASKEEGWKRGLNLLQAMAANARYFTDAASKIPHDVAQGDAVAGTCIDFYGRSYEEKLGKRGPSRLIWTAPLGGTSISVDPIAVFRGAPSPQIAQEFVTFVLSDQGQLLWNLKVGIPGGPREASPRRLPVRKDLYTPENITGKFADPVALPYERSGGFEYRWRPHRRYVQCPAPDLPRHVHGPPPGDEAGLAGDPGIGEVRIRLHRHGSLRPLLRYLPPQLRPREEGTRPPRRAEGQYGQARGLPRNGPHLRRLPREL